MPSTPTAAKAGRGGRLARWMRRLVIGVGLASLGASACASAFVSYDFSSQGEGPLMTGTLTFSTGMPVIDRCCNWVEYQPSAVVSLSRANDAGTIDTWTNAATPNGYCSVWFHVGWSQVAVWCHRVQDPEFMPGVDLIRIDFVSAFGNSPSFDPDPVGPFTPENFRQERVWGEIGAIGGPMTDWVMQGLSLDAIRITPYVSEPGLPALLSAGAAAGWWARRRRPRPADRV